MRKTAFLLITALFFLAFLAGCSERKQQKETSTTVCHRIVSVSPQVTELLCDLGCKDRIIARTDFCVFPKEVENIPSVGGINDASTEKIIAMQPDIVFVSSIFGKKSYDVLVKAGLKAISFHESNTIEGMYGVIDTLAHYTGTEAKADSIKKMCSERLDKIKKRNSEREKSNSYKKPKVCYIVGFGAGGDFAAGKDTYIHNILTLAGGDNIAKDAVNWSFSKERLFAEEPDFIFIRKQDIERFRKEKPYCNLKAVKSGRVYGMDNMDLQTPRSIDAVEYIDSVIHASL